MTRLRAIGTALALSLALIGCSGDDAAMETSSDSAEGGFSDMDTTEEAAEPAPQGDQAEAPADSVDGDGPAAAPATSGVRANRRVIRTAELTLEVEDTATALEQILATAERVGGFAATSDLQRDLDGVVRGTITLRVPSAELNQVVDELEAIGDAVPVNRIDERDVTMESADLRARIDNLTAYEVELVGLLADIREETSRPEDLLTIFERIRSVREEIDVLEGRLAALDDQVAMSTVRVNLQPTKQPATISEVGWAPGETFSDALATTGRALAAIADAAIWVAVTAVPVVLTLLVIPLVLLIGLIRWLRHRNRKDATGPPSGPPPSSTPATPPATPAG